MSQHKVFQLLNWDEFAEPRIIKPEPPKAPELVKMMYKNPKSKDKAVQQGVMCMVDLNKKQLLLVDDGAGVYNCECVWSPDWINYGAWLIPKYLTRVEESNEFGVVSP